MPNLWVVRPADGNETREAWKLALKRTDGPTALVLSRQGLPTLDHPKMAEDFPKGAYVLRDSKDAKAIILATGSEVSLAIAVCDALAKQGVGVRVVSMPCWEAFLAQPASYRDQVLPPAMKNRVSVEAGVTFGWHQFIGERGIAMSGPAGPGTITMGVNETWNRMSASDLVRAFEQSLT
jgi:transketolase